MNIDESMLKSGVEVLKQVGFPAAVAFWFMFRTDKILNALTNEMRELRMAVLGMNSKPPRRNDADD